MQDNKALTGIKSAWAYSSSGFNLKSTLKLADDHTIGYADPIVDVRKKNRHLFRILTLMAQLQIARVLNMETGHSKQLLIIIMR